MLTVPCDRPSFPLHPHHPLQVVRCCSQAGEGAGGGDGGGGEAGTVAAGSLPGALQPQVSEGTG